jgi:hypothetical protein
MERRAHEKARDADDEREDFYGPEIASDVSEVSEPLPEPSELDDDDEESQIEQDDSIESTSQDERESELIQQF